MKISLLKNKNLINSFVKIIILCSVRVLEKDLFSWKNKENKKKKQQRKAYYSLHPRTTLYVLCDEKRRIKDED